MRIGSDITKILANEIRVVESAQLAIGAVPETLIEGKDRLMHDLQVARNAFYIAFNYAVDIDRVATRKKGHQEEKKPMIVDAEEVIPPGTAYSVGTGVTFTVSPSEQVLETGFNLGTVTTVPYPVKGSDPFPPKDGTTGPLEEWPFKPNTQMLLFKPAWKELLQEYLKHRVYAFDTHKMLRECCENLNIGWTTGTNRSSDRFAIEVEDIKGASVSTLVKLFAAEQQCYAPVELAPENPLDYYEKDWKIFIAGKLKGVFEKAMYPKMIAAAETYYPVKPFNSLSITLPIDSYKNILTLLEIYAAKREDEGVVW